MSGRELVPFRCEEYGGAFAEAAGGALPLLHPPISPSHSVRFQEVPRAQDGNAPKGLELTKVFIPRDHNLSFRLDGTFENAVIRFVLSDEPDRFLRVDEPSELLDGGNGLARARAGPLKFAH